MDDEERKPWDSMDDEKMLWYSRFLVYLRMGPKRSVNAVFAKETRKDGKRRGIEAPGAWYDIEKEWKWIERARAYDESLRAEEDKIIAEEKAKVLRSGYALMHKRVHDLDKLSRKLISYTRDEDKVWIPEIKTTTRGEESVQVVEKIVFNAPLFTLIDRYFASIAAELGERVKKAEVTGKDGGPVEVDVIVETHWGRGTDPRKATSEDAPQEIQSDEEPEMSVEFGTDDEVEE